MRKDRFHSAFTACTITEDTPPPGSSPDFGHDPARRRLKPCTNINHGPTENPEMPTWNPNRITNPFFSLTLEPRHGGRIISLETATGSELTVGATPADLSRARVSERFGLLAVQLWQDSYWHNDINHLEWPIVGTSVTPASVVVSLAGRSVVWPRVTVERHVRVTNDPWIDVEHDLNPGLITASYAPPAFWFSSVVRTRGHTFVPSPVGVLDLPRWVPSRRLLKWLGAPPAR
jgi:hypothetical protein